MIVQLVTDRRRLAGAAASDADATRRLIEQVRVAAVAGIDLVHLREPDLSARVLTSLVEACVAVTTGTSTRIVVNDRVDVALAGGAHGVHLRANSMRAADVRTLTPKPFLIGVSVHSVAEVGDAAGADYVVAGTVWASASKTAPGYRLLGAEGLREIVAAAECPVLAIGGVTAERIEAVAAAGAAGIAAIGLFTGPADAHPDRGGDLRASVDLLRRRFGGSTGVT